MIAGIDSGVFFCSFLQHKNIAPDLPGYQFFICFNLRSWRHDHLIKMNIMSRINNYVKMKYSEVQNGGSKCPQQNAESAASVCMRQK